MSVRIAPGAPFGLRFASATSRLSPARLRLALPALRPDVSRDAMLLIGLLVGIATARGGFVKPVDAVVYWQAGTSSALYPQSWSECCEGHLFYPPPIAQLSTLMQPLGWHVFVVLLTVAIFASMWYCARGWSIPLLLVGVPYYLDVGPELPATFLSYALTGNIQWILAALTIVAFAHPAAYGLLAVSKVTSAIGWLWPVFRREWSAALVGAAATIALVAVSLAIAPMMWFDYAAFVARNAAMADPPLPMFPIPFPIRLAGAVALIAWGAPRDRRWVVPIAAGFAIPAVWGFGFLPFVVAALRLRRSPLVVDRA